MHLRALNCTPICRRSHLGWPPSHPTRSHVSWPKGLSQFVPSKSTFWYASNKLLPCVRFDSWLVCQKSGMKFTCPVHPNQTSLIWVGLPFGLNFFRVCLVHGARLSFLAQLAKLRCQECVRPRSTQTYCGFLHFLKNFKKILIFSVTLFRFLTVSSCYTSIAVS